MNPKKYKKGFEHSYSLGPFPTFELINAAPERVKEVFISDSFNDKEKLTALCREKNIAFSFSDKALQRISDKEAVYAAAAFEKYESDLSEDKSHVVLVNPADMGNIGTIARTALGFGFLDLAVIEPAADIFNPKTVRASMGALFRIRCKRYPSFDEYLKAAGQRDLFPFMLENAEPLTPETRPKSEKFSLIFGSEARGLPKEFKDIGKPLYIPQTQMVDSLNLSIAAGIGCFLFRTVWEMEN